MASFDLIRNTATELQELLSRGDITSTRLVKETLAQIDAHDPSRFEVEGSRTTVVPGRGCVGPATGVV
jgi:Asp-tRNA(Asn)/Glu-tRNA(Gln) amidotransferase A subunit family amidase